VRRLASAAAFALAFFAAAPAAAQSIGGGSNPITLIVLLGALAVLPFLLIMVTSFVKVAVVLSILRQAIGAQQVPPNQIITGLAIVLSLYIMAPVGFDMYNNIRPQLDNLREGEQSVGVEQVESIARGVAGPLRTFLVRHSDTRERSLLHRLALELDAPRKGERRRPRLELADDNLLVLVPAFVVTELKEAFTIGFILFIPFIIIDLVVANILLSLGMHMLSPTTISLPFKLLLFVLVDGWFLVVKGLVLGYTPG